MESTSESLEEKVNYEEVNWKTAIKMGLWKQFLPLGIGVYFLAKDLNNKKPTFFGSGIYHSLLSLAPYAYALDKYLNQ